MVGRALPAEGFGYITQSGGQCPPYIFCVGFGLVVWYLRVFSFPRSRVGKYGILIYLPGFYDLCLLKHCGSRTAGEALFFYSQKKYPKKAATPTTPL